MFTHNSTLVQTIAATRINERRARSVPPMPSSLGNTFLPITCRVSNADLALFPGKQHTIDKPLLHVGDEITVTRRLMFGYGFIYFFTTQAGLEGFIRSDAVSEVRNG